MANKRAKKTVSVDFVKAMVNRFLEVSADDQQNDRRGAYIVLESILHDTGNYHGFNYLSWLNGGCEQWRADGEPKDNDKYLGDKSRRFYY